jgi:hypothetical protein
VARIFVAFNADSGEELAELFAGFLAHRNPPSWLGQPSPPSDPEAAAAAEMLSDADYDAQFPDDDEAGSATIVGKPEPEAEPVRVPRKSRATRAVSAPPETLQNGPEPEPTTTPAPPPPPPPSADLPQLDALKQAVTVAVRQAQKGEGSRQILDLLPGFKSKTGLAFVMEAEDKHRPALFELVQAAGLSPV